VSDKQAAQTQVAWALLTEGAASARLDAHRIRHLVQRGLGVVAKSPEKEAIYEAAGDIIQVLPRRLDSLETHLDRLSYALSVLGKDHLRERLPMDDRATVDDATHRARPFASPSLQGSASRVAYRYLRKQK